MEVFYNKSRYFWNLIKINKKKIINFDNIVNIKFLSIIEILNSNSKIMMECYYEILKISKLYPPQKNENKFIYGKLIEKSIINAFRKCGFICIDLDKNHKCGSEYKNDIKILKIDISIKAKLNKGGNVIMINKNSSNKHNLNINTLICVIKEGKLYFIPNNLIEEKFIIENAGNISYKYSLINNIEKNYSQYIYKFPQLTNELQNIISLLEEIPIYDKLYEMIQI